MTVPYQRTKGVRVECYAFREVHARRSSSRVHAGVCDVWYALLGIFFVRYASGTDAIGYEYLLRRLKNLNELICHEWWSLVPSHISPSPITQLSFLMLRNHHIGFVQAIAFSAVEMHDR